MDPGGRTFTVQNTANIDGSLVVQGTDGNDTLTVLRTAGGGMGDLTYVLNSAAPVSLTGVTDATFLGGGGADTLALDFVNGAPQINGVFDYDGSTGASRLVVDESALKTADVIGLAPGVVYSTLTDFAVFYGGTSGGLFAPAFADGVLVVTGTGDSSVYVDQPDRMTGIPFGVQSGGGADQLVINDTDLNGFDEVGVTPGGVFSPVGWSVDFVAAGGSFGRGVYLTTGGGAEVYVVRPDNMGGVPFTVTSTGARQRPRALRDRPHRRGHRGRDPRRGLQHRERLYGALQRHVRPGPVRRDRVGRRRRGRVQPRPDERDAGECGRRRRRQLPGRNSGRPIHVERGQRKR